MKTICLILAVAIIAVNCSNEKITIEENINTSEKALHNQTDCEKFGLKGKVKQWIRQSFGCREESGKLIKVLLNKELYRFNESGMQVEVKGFNENDEIISESFYSYNSDGEIAEETYYDGNGELLAKVTLYYDDNGNKIKEIKEDRTGQLVYTSLWKYNKKGNIIEFTKKINENSKGSILSKVETEYDKNGNISREQRIEYRIDGGIHFKKIIQYNVYGKMMTMEEYNSENEITNKLTYSYNKNGKLVKLADYFYNYETKEYNEKITSYEYDKNGKMLQCKEPGHTTVYTYDDNGNEREVVEYNESNILASKILKAYDDKNNKREEIITTYTKNGNIENTYVYTYDENENLIRWAKYNHEGSLLYQHPTLYDKDGNKVEEVEESTMRLPKIKYRYRYDEAGNHIETKCYRLHDHNEGELALMYEYLFTYWE